MGQPQEPKKPSPQQVTHMVDAGRVSLEEAERLTKGDAASHIAAMRDIRSRHLRERLAPILATGLIDETEAADLIARIDMGDHDAAVRRRINRLAREAAARSGGQA